jgi:hypothetical protein
MGEMYLLALLKPSFSRCSHTLSRIREGDPLSLPKGEAAQGERPPDPLFEKPDYPSVAIALLGDALRGGEPSQI